MTGERGAIKQQFSERPASLLEEDDNVRDEARQAYRARSELIHGKRTFDQIGESTRQSAFWLARHSLLRILEDEQLLRMFSGPDDECGDYLSTLDR